MAVKLAGFILRASLLFCFQEWAGSNDRFPHSKHSKQFRNGNRLFEVMEKGGMSNPNKTAN